MEEDRHNSKEEKLSVQESILPGTRSPPIINDAFEVEQPVTSAPNNPSVISHTSIPLTGENHERQVKLGLLSQRIAHFVKISAKQFHLSPSVVNEKIYIDILVLGRAGVGKSQLVKAITNRTDIISSAQLDHVTTHLTASIFEIENITYRFWDSRGIDKWNDGEEAGKLIEELEKKKINPMFIIYCAAAMGRVATNEVKKVLHYLSRHNVPIAYVITNMFGASDVQREAQIQGGIEIMDEIFVNQPIKCGRFHYEFHGLLQENDEYVIHEGNGILIAVNSCEYVNEDFGISKGEENIHTLMNFIATHLEDEQLSQFVLMTLENRTFWQKITDVLYSRLESAFKAFGKARDFFMPWFFELKRVSHRSSTSK